MFDKWGLDTQGGHIVVCFALFAVGAVFFKFGIPKAEDIVLIAIGALGRSMVGKNES